jgi:hypothetical protein
MLLLALALSGAMFVGLTNPDAAVRQLSHGSNAGEKAAIIIVWEFLYQHRLPTMLILAAMVAAAMVAWVLLVRKRLLPALFALACMVWLMFLPYVAFVEPLKDNLISPRRVALEIAGMLPPGAELYSGGQEYQHSFRWYLQHNIRLESPHAAEARARQEPASWVVIFSKRPLDDSLLNSRPGVRQWQVDYYHMTLFPGRDSG